MAVWEDAGLPTTRAPAGCWWGTLMPKEMGGNPQVNRQDVRGRGGRSSGGRTGLAPLKPGRSGDVGGRSRGRLTRPLGYREPAELPGRFPALQSPLQAVWVPGGIGGRLRGEQERQVGGALRDRRSSRGAEGVCPAHSSSGKPAGLPGEAPRPLRPGVGPRLGPFCSLSLSPTPPTAPKAFSSPVGPEHRPHPPPKLRPCLGPTLHSQGLSPPLCFPFSFPSSSFLLLWYCCTFQLLIHFYFCILSNISVSFLV